MATEPATVPPPKHPLCAMTTFELRDYRRDLERAVVFLDAQEPVPPVRATLQAKLDDVIAEQADRAKLADHA
jgi:hypothetical protein